MASKQLLEILEFARSLRDSAPDSETDARDWLRRLVDLTDTCLPAGQLATPLASGLPIQIQSQFRRWLLAIRASAQSRESRLRHNIDNALDLIIEALGQATQNESVSAGFTLESIPTRVQQLSSIQKVLFDRIWNHHLISDAPYPYRALAHLIGKNPIKDVLSGLNGSLLYETTEQGEKGYKLTLYGALLAEDGCALAVLLLHLFELIRRLFLDQPQFKSIDETSIQRALNLSDEEMHILHRALRLTLPIGLPAYMSGWALDGKTWQMSVTDEIVALYQSDSTEQYLAVKLSTGYLPTKPVAHFEQWTVANPLPLSSFGRSEFQETSEHPMAKKSTEPQHVKLSSDQMRDAIPKLMRRLEELKNLDPEKLQKRGDPKFEAIESKANHTLADIFGVGTVQYNNNHVMLDTASIHFGGGTPLPEVIDGYKDGISTAIERFQALVDYFQEELRERIGTEEPHRKSTVPTQSAKGAGQRVFIVHGHDQGALQEVARFVERLGLEAIVLHERANEGQTIIEKFEKHAQHARFAIVLLTPDDIGHAVDDPNAAKPRARQNVILELGYFAGRLGRNHVVALKKQDVEIPSDLHGVLYEPMDARGSWKFRIAQEMAAAGISIDLNRLR